MSIRVGEVEYHGINFVSLNSLPNEEFYVYARVPGGVQIVGRWGSCVMSDEELRVNLEQRMQDAMRALEALRW